jgi:hypothetical protein
MNKKEKVKRYFDKVVLKNYFSREKITKQALKAAAKTLNIFYSEAKTEHRKAYVRLSVRINYLKRSHKVTFLNYKTGITKEKLINLTLNGNIDLSKKGVNDVVTIHEAIKEVNGLAGSTAKVVEYEDNQETNSDSYNISVKYFLETLLKQINTVYSGNINAMFLSNGSVFFSNNAMYRAIKEYYKITMIGDIGSISGKKAKGQTLWLINKFREMDMLFHRINKGYYSNTAIIKFEDGRSQKVYGIFLKIEKLNIDILNLKFPPLPDKFKNVTDISVDKKKIPF